MACPGTSEMNINEICQYRYFITWIVIFVNFGFHNNRRMRRYEAEIEGWKRNYVSIVQSCIHYPTGDSMDGAEVTLYGEEMVGVQAEDCMCRCSVW